MGARCFNQILSGCTLLVGYFVYPTASAQQLLRFDEDRASRCARGDPSLAQLCWRANDMAFAVGGEVRERYEYQRNPSFGETAAHDSAWMQRLAAHLDVAAGERLRGYLEFHSAVAARRTGEPGPTEENSLTFQNLFMEIRAGASAYPVVTRIGRQEYNFGSGRLVSVREGPNVRRTFDGLSISSARSGFRTTALAVRPRQDRPDVFDDKSDDDRSLVGVYSTVGNPFGLPGSVDVYYLLARNKNAIFANATGDEKRHSLGLRLFGEAAGWDWNFEPIVQFGSVGARDIRAGTTALIFGFTFERLASRPRMGLSINYASGDKGDVEDPLATFSPLYPRGNYFSQAAILGPYNFYNLDPSISFSPAANLELTMDWNIFWRAQKNDAVYAPNGAILTEADASAGRSVAQSLSVQAEWSVTSSVAATLSFTYFQPQGVLEAAGKDQDIEFLELTMQWRF